MELNNKCYRFEKKIFNDGLLNENIDATYILHLENNGRINDILLQLQKYHTTNIIYILYNKGYKKCIKQNYIKNSMYDIVDANLEIFKHAYNQNYNNILILEDDFIFDNKILNINHINNINNFIKKKLNDNFIYHLGCQPILYRPYDSYNNLLYFGSGMHSAIFSKKFRNIFLYENIKDISDWDLYLNFKTERYFYYEPLCYQYIIETENSKNYPSYFGLTKFFNLFIILLKLDKEPIEGYNKIYILSKFGSILILFLIIIFIIYILYLIKIIKIN